jgi:hypothetical protein
MKDGKYSLDILRKTFRDISKGFSFGYLENKKVYIKHFLTEDFISIEEKKKEYYEKAKQRGLPTENCVLLRLKKDGIWTDKNEEFMLSQKAIVDNLIVSKKNSAIPSQTESFQKKIDEENQKLFEIEQKRKIFIGRTCETYRDIEANKYFITCSLYTDEKCEKRFFETEEDIDEFDNFESINTLYDSSTSHLTIDHILHLVVHPIFLQYFYLLGDDISIFFGKPIVFLSFLQVELLHSALKYRNIFRELGEISEDISLDPYKIAEFADNAKNMEKILENKGGGENSIKSVVGAKEKDLKKMGLGSINSMFREKAKQKGGSLNKADIANLLKSTK